MLSRSDGTASTRGTSRRTRQVSGADVYVPVHPFMMFRFVPSVYVPFLAGTMSMLSTSRRTRQVSGVNVSFLSIRLCPLSDLLLNIRIYVYTYKGTPQHAVNVSFRSIRLCPLSDLLLIEAFI
jgi:hypothetical protein